MPTRLAFHEELRVLEDDLLAMADLVQTAIEQAVRGLLQHDSNLATEVVEADDRINDLFVRIEREILELIATQQPMATDLREVMSVLAIATDLERIGDHAKGIGKITLRMDQVVESPALVHIDQMREMVRQALADEMDAFIQRDPNAARSVASRDDEIDKLYSKVYEELLEQMVNQKHRVKASERLLWVAKGLERCGDHVTNIGERVVFLTTGHHVELND